ncbi:iron ABC transporter permease [Mangrovactinospora gilvigrisea]|uniref:Iron ABC transporter permease n=1 Tax=Mangrovactinospora gilvigrisea TaxID=1428644 RepID=A0A1J7BXQ0_9ACTN|nr:iron chelate uptake ABC transporter family permease subunit [Mangrovactinospora gilvigrisea]OIV38273.1 iron ABC transporter permease [Mangrovactinospora gilvigrisea]
MPRTAPRLAALLVAALALLAVTAALSIAVGTKGIGPAGIWHALAHPTGTYDDTVVRRLRLPRTALGLAAGASLGLAGALMQGLTRNPLADPGILGVNAGASLGAVAAISLLGVQSPSGFVWFALAGAAAATAVVYLLGAGRSGRGAAATPVRLALAGTAVQAALLGVNQAFQILDSAALDKMRFWVVGALTVDNGMHVLAETGPLMLLGALIALGLARPLNAVALGEDSARALGARPGRTRALAVLAITLLCGAATAACGPIGFLGLMIPHAARALTGPDQRWILPFSMVLAPVLLLGSDVLARVAAGSDSELQVGVVTAVLGGLAFVLLVRSRRMAEL